MNSTLLVCYTGNMVATKNLAAHAALLGALLLPACAVARLGKIDLSGCMAGCNASNKQCLKETSTDCPTGDQCWNVVQSCFDSITECSDDCLLKKKQGLITNDGFDECNTGCTHEGKACADMIHPCVDKQKACADTTIDGKQGCVTTMTDCVTACIKGAEDLIKGN